MTKEDNESMECPCKECDIRKAYAKDFDIHIYGEDCFFECDEYTKWYKEQMIKG